MQSSYDNSCRRGLLGTFWIKTKIFNMAYKNLLKLPVHLFLHSTHTVPLLVPWTENSQYAFLSSFLILLFLSLSTLKNRLHILQGSSLFFKFFSLLFMNLYFSCFLIIDTTYVYCVLCACLCVCVCKEMTYICVHIYTHIYAYIYVCVYICTHMCVCVLRERVIKPDKLDKLSNFYLQILK